MSKTPAAIEPQSPPVSDSNKTDESAQAWQAVHLSKPQQLVPVFPKLWNRERLPMTHKRAVVLFPDFDATRQTLPPNCWPSFPGGGVPQRLKANPANVATEDLLHDFHCSSLCAYKSIRLVKRGYYVLQVTLSAGQLAALPFCPDAVLAGCLPVVIHPGTYELVKSELEGFIVAIDAAQHVRVVHASYTDANAYASRGSLITRGELIANLRDSGAEIKPGNFFCILNTSLIPAGCSRLLFHLPCCASATQHRNLRSAAPPTEDETPARLVLEQMATHPRTVCNDLLAARRVRAIGRGAAPPPPNHDSSSAAGHPGGPPHDQPVPPSQLGDLGPRPCCTPGRILQNILTVRNSLRDPGVEWKLPVSRERCLDIFAMEVRTLWHELHQLHCSNGKLLRDDLMDAIACACSHASRDPHTHAQQPVSYPAGPGASRDRQPQDMGVEVGTGYLQSAATMEQDSKEQGGQTWPDARTTLLPQNRLAAASSRSGAFQQNVQLAQWSSGVPGSQLVAPRVRMRGRSSAFHPAMRLRQDAGELGAGALGPQLLSSGTFGAVHVPLGPTSIPPIPLQYSLGSNPITMYDVSMERSYPYPPSSGHVPQSALRQTGTAAVPSNSVGAAAAPHACAGLVPVPMDDLLPQTVTNAPLAIGHHAVADLGGSGLGSLALTARGAVQRMRSPWPAGARGAPALTSQAPLEGRITHSAPKRARKN